MVVTPSTLEVQTTNHVPSIATGGDTNTVNLDQIRMGFYIGMIDWNEGDYMERQHPDDAMDR